MGTKINNIRQQTPYDGILLTSWLEKSGLSRSEISDYTESGWLQRIATGYIPLSAIARLFTEYSHPINVKALYRIMSEPLRLWN